MKTLFLSMFLLCGGLSFCQTSIYHPFPTNNAVWNYHASPGCISSYPIPYYYKYSVSMKGDTLIGGRVYKKLITDYIESFGPCVFYTAGYQGAIFVDNVARKVYEVKPNKTSPDLIFDFNLQVGDSLAAYKPQTYFMQGDGIVESIDSVLVGNTYRKRWNIGACTRVSYVEGVGLTERYPHCFIDGPPYITMTCMKKGFFATYPNANEICNLITTTNDQLESNQKVKVYPIPSQGSIKIELSNSRFEKVELIDMVGKTILQKSITEATQLELVNLPKGVFILNLTGKGAKGYSMRVTVL